MTNVQLSKMAWLGRKKRFNVDAESLISPAREAVVATDVAKVQSLGA